MSDRKIIVAFGDSVTQGITAAGGAADHHSFTWRVQLQRKLKKGGLGVRVINAGVSGGIDNSLRRIQDDVLYYEPDIVLCMFGTDDSMLTVSDKPSTSLPHFERKLKKIVSRIKDAGLRAILITPPPLTERMPLFMERAAYLEKGPNCSLERFVRRIKAVSRSTRTPLIDIYEKVLRQKDYKTGIIPEGHLPGALGSPFIAEAIAKEIREKLEKKKAEREKVVKIVAWGDSVTNCLSAEVTSHSQTWRVILEKGLKTACINAEVENAGIPCDRCVNAIARFEDDVKPYNPDYVTIMLGLNDAWLFPETEKNAVPPQLFFRTLKNMVKLVRGVGAEPALISPNPLGQAYFASRKRRIYRERGLNYPLGLLVKAMKRCARDVKCSFIDIFSLMLSDKNYEKKWVTDAIHPNVRGNKFIAEILLEYFKKKLSSAR